MARRNVYDISDLIQFGMDNGFTDKNRDEDDQWNKLAELVQEHVNIFHETSMDTFVREEVVKDFEANPGEYTVEHVGFLDLLFSFMDAKKKKQVSFIRD